MGSYVFSGSWGIEKDKIKSVTRRLKSTRKRFNAKVRRGKGAEKAKFKSVTQRLKGTRGGNGSVRSTLAGIPLRGATPGEGEQLECVRLQKQRVNGAIRPTFQTASQQVRAAAD